MPKIETNDSSFELKIYLRQLLKDNKLDELLDNILTSRIISVSARPVARNAMQLRTVRFFPKITMRKAPRK